MRYRIEAADGTILALFNSVPDEIPEGCKLRPHDGKPVKEPAPTVEDTWREVKRRRNVILNDKAWTVAPASPLTPANQAKWLQYLKKLNRLTISGDDPSALSWPKEPPLEYAVEP